LLDATQTPIHHAAGLALVADDTELVRIYLSRLLDDAGYRVIVAETGEEALALVRANRGTLRLAIVDVVMPLMNGVDLALLMASEHPGIAVVLMSAHPTEIDRFEDASRGGVPFVAKPFEPDLLFEQIDAAMTVAAARLP
jgi:DNA-binding NtrC family response regulator